MDSQYDPLISLGADSNIFIEKRVTKLRTEDELLLINNVTQDEIVLLKVRHPQGLSGFSLSPDGKKMAFSLGQAYPPANDFNIYVLDIDSGELDQITHSNDNKYPVWSPTKNIIAYIKKDTDRKIVQDSLYLYNLEKSCNVRLVTEVWSMPTWSPDGTRLAFAAPRSGDIYIADISRLLETDNWDDCE
jgi:Tol biopolymer transport system component